MCHFAVLPIELGECLDMIAGKGDGNDQDVFLSPGSESPEHLLSARAEPAHRSHVRLIRQYSRDSISRVAPPPAERSRPPPEGKLSPRSITSSGKEWALNRISTFSRSAGSNWLHSVAHRLGHRIDEARNAPASGR